MHDWHRRYKREVEKCMEREASLERSKAQLQLDWQKRFDDIERLQYEKSEDLVRHLTQARDEVSAPHSSYLIVVGRRYTLQSSLSWFWTSDRFNSVPDIFMFL